MGINDATPEKQTAVDALRLVETFARSVVSDPLGVSLQDLSKNAAQTAFSSGLPSKERDALFQALFSIVDAVAAIRRAADEAAANEAAALFEAAALELNALKEKSEFEGKEAARRKTAFIGALICLAVALLGLYLQAETAATVVFLTGVAFVAPEVIASLRGLWK